MAKTYAEKEHEHWYYVVMGFMLLFLIGVHMITSTNKIQDLEDKTNSLENEIATMPHYICWNESFNGFINFNETDSFCFGAISSNKSYCGYKGYSAECDTELGLCYIDDIKEICMLDKHYVLLGEKE